MLLISSLSTEISLLENLVGDDLMAGHSGYVASLSFRYRSDFTLKAIVFGCN